MVTLNISLPEKLRDQVDELIEQGHYVSVSDAIRTALRDMVTNSLIEKWVKEAKHDVKMGQAVILKSKSDITKYMDTL